MRTESLTLSRRTFLQSSAAFGLALSAPSGWAVEDRKPAPDPLLAGQVGITTSSLSGHVAQTPARGKITLFEWPRVLREELDLRVIDLNTTTLGSFEPARLDRFREAAEKAGCALTNLKMNQRGLDVSSPEAAIREQALAEYRRSIDAAARLGLKWARVLPTKERPDLALHVLALQKLADYAAPRKIQLLVENYGWMESDADSVVKLMKAVGRNVLACPDTGNWSDNAVREAGLARTFPQAVTCDFKAKTLGPQGEHAAYDLKRCFLIGWRAGFRGPWCLEHAHRDRQTLFRDLTWLRDQLRGWMQEQQAAPDQPER